MGCFAHLFWPVAVLSFFLVRSGALDNGVGRVPVMGWSTWNHFDCRVGSEVILDTASALVSSGLRDAGYKYLNIDDCWQDMDRDAQGSVKANANFPGGIKALADKLHKMQLKIGIYTCAGEYTCQFRPGSQDHQCQDAQTYADWGIDFVKEDWCYTSGWMTASMDPKKEYSTMRDCLNATGREIVFNSCNWGVDEPWEWGSKTANMWRATPDISDTWSSFNSILDQMVGLNVYAEAGAWNDADSLEVGNGGMSFEEYKAQFMLWSVMKVPLILGHDIAKMDDGTKRIVTSKEIISVNQDPRGLAGTKIVESNDGNMQVWATKLAPFTRAVVLFNKKNVDADMSISWTDLGFTGSQKLIVRDLWEEKSLGEFSDRFTTTVPSHGAVMVKISSPSARLSDQKDDWLPRSNNKMLKVAQEKRESVKAPWADLQAFQHVISGFSIGVADQSGLSDLRTCWPDAQEKFRLIRNEWQNTPKDLKGLLKILQDLVTDLGEIADVCHLDTGITEAIDTVKDLFSEEGREKLKHILLKNLVKLIELGVEISTGFSEGVYGKAGIAIGEIFVIVGEGA